MTIVTTKDTRALQYCNKGVRAFCQQHNIDYQNFIKNGIDADDLLKTNDVMAIKLIEYAKSKEITHEQK